jgi:adenosylmethionine-8-amino-7-oxononanoate aminotransferase
MKFARQYFKQTGRGGKYKFVSRYQGYHGSTFGAMGASGTGPRKSKFEPQMGGFLKVFPPTFYRDRFASWDECNRFAARSVEDVILAEDPATVAGVIVEPVGNTGGIITPTEEYFRILREICTRHDVLLIFDEVITGFARTGRMFAAQTFGVTPDILCAGKGLSSGMVPLGSMIAREDLGEPFLGPAAAGVQFAHGNTFAGNPLACAVGIAVIDEIVENRLDQKAQRLGEYLAGKLDGLRRHGVIRDIRGKGLLRGVEFGRDSRPLPAGKKLGAALKRKAIDNGLIMRIDPDWFAVAPAVIAEEKDIDELVGLIDRSLGQAIEEVRP